MKIIELKSQNIKNIKAVAIKPGDGSVVLEGPNGAGKSAVLDSILAALAGHKLPDPIRHGEERAEINVDLGDLIVKKIITPKGDRLEITTKDGAVLKSPQAALDKLIGDLSFDPLAFSTMKPAVQLELLKSLVGLDFTSYDKNRQDLYTQRTAINRQIKDTEALIDATTIPDPGTPAEEISFADEFQKLNDLKQRRKDFLKVVDHKQDRLEFLGEVEGEIQATKIQIENLQKELSSLDKKRSELSVEIENIQFPEEITEEKIKEAEGRIGQIEEKNRKIRAAKSRNELIEAVKKHTAAADNLTDGINKIDEEKQDLIEKAQFPIEGLDLTDQCVCFNGTPFEQLSTGEKIRVSTAIAMKLNPTLKVIFIRDGSLLDSAGMKEIEALAAAEGYQLWIERVSDDKEGGIFIEDGQIVEQPA